MTLAPSCRVWQKGKHRDTDNIYPVAYGEEKKVRAGIVRAPSELVRSLIYDSFFEDEAAAGGANASLGDVGVVVGRMEEEGEEGEEGEEEDTLQGRDVYWWTLFTNAFLFSPKASLLEHVRRTRLALGWSENARVGMQFSKSTL